MVAFHDSHSANSEPLYNSRVIKNYTEYINRFHPDVDVNALLGDAGIADYELEDEGHWFTQEQHDRFHDILTKRTGDHQISLKVGRYAPQARSAGILPRRRPH